MSETMSSTLIERMQEWADYYDDLRTDWVNRERAALLREAVTALRTQKPSEPAVSFCPEDGFNVECDEDGCCVTCGATAMGEAVKALRVFSAQWRQAPTEADQK